MLALQPPLFVATVPSTGAVSSNRISTKSVMPSPALQAAAKVRLRTLLVNVIKRNRVPLQNFESGDLDLIDRYAQCAGRASAAVIGRIQV